MSYESYIPDEIRNNYEIHDFRHAAAILKHEFPLEFDEIINALLKFKIRIQDFTDKGGSESQIPKRISTLLRPLNWVEGQLNAKLVVNEETISFDTHKIDYLKGRVAFDMEWNSKDQTYDRDLYAFRAFFDYNRISVGVLLTRSISLNPIFKRLGVMQKYGASTTHIGKLIPRLKAGRNGGCPVLVVGITPAIIEDGEKLLTNLADFSSNDEISEIEDLSLKAEEVIIRENISKSPETNEEGI